MGVIGLHLTLAVLLRPGSRYYYGTWVSRLPDPGIFTFTNGSTERIITHPRFRFTTHKLPGYMGFIGLQPTPAVSLRLGSQYYCGTWESRFPGPDNFYSLQASYPERTRSLRMWELQRALQYNLAWSYSYDQVRLYNRAGKIKRLGHSIPRSLYLYAVD